MRKFLFVLFALLTISVSCVEIKAQTKKRPPLPDWIWEKPQRSNITFYYHREKGVGETEQEARNAAYTQAFMQVALKLGIPLNTEDLSEAVASGTNIRMLSQRFTIPMNVVCTCSRPNEQSGGWNYWILCQIPEIGYADNARFDDFNECFKFEKYEERQKKKDAEEEQRKQEEKRMINKSNARALVASTFIPGMGQMLKKQGGKGTAFLLSELVVFGGGTACYFLGQEQSKKMKAIGTTYDEYKKAKDMKNTYNIAMYACFGVGAAIHITNMVHAWCVKDKNIKAQARLIPAIIPVNELSQPSYAYGAGVQIQF